MCNAAVQQNNDMIKYIPDWFVTAGMLEKCKRKWMVRSHISSVKQKKQE